MGANLPIWLQELFCLTFWQGLLGNIAPIEWRRDLGCLTGIVFGVVGFFIAGPIGSIIGLLTGILGAVSGKRR